MGLLLLVFFAEGKAVQVKKKKPLKDRIAEKEAKRLEEAKKRVSKKWYILRGLIKKAVDQNPDHEILRLFP